MYALKRFNLTKHVGNVLNKQQLLRMTTANIKVVSAEEREKLTNAQAMKRPIAPHFTIYKWPFAGLASGTQRVTGAALVFAWTGVALLALPGMPVTALPAVIEGVKNYAILYQPIKAGLAFAFTYHATKNTLLLRQSRLDVPNVNKLAQIAIATGLVTAGVVVFLF
mmetsp:Transcript_78791/g.96346  ORF Transcript_78791/g.96346 Transcript_78791/m.96346 type:complete len:166 (-) Transcript_78791:113-610(-)